jgi:hypothetical protein
MLWKGQFTLEYLLLREIMTHSKLKLLIGSQNNTLELLLALGFTVLQQGCFRAQPTQAQKRLWMEKSYMAEVDNVGQDWKGICFVLFCFLGVPTSLRWQTMGAHIFRGLELLLS